MTIGRNLRHFRKMRGFTQAELSKASGAKQATISDIERGRVRDPHPSTLRKLAEVLDVEVADFFAEEPPRPKASPSAGSREWALETSVSEVEAWAETRAQSADKEALENVLRALREEAGKVADLTGNPRTGRAYPPSPEINRIWARYGEITRRREIVRQALERITPPPPASITLRRNEPPLVEWHIPEAQRTEWREKLDESFPEGFEEVYEPVPETIAKQ